MLKRLKKIYHDWMRNRLASRLGYLPLSGLSATWYGNDYGGFYVSSSQAKERGVVYSFGIGLDISFDRAVIEAHKSNVFAFDPTPKSLRWLASQDLPETYQFFPYGISKTSGTYNFYLPQIEDHVSGSIVEAGHLSDDSSIEVELRSINDITNELGHKHIDLLKMDIEGAEYEVVPSILSSGIEISQLLIEFHHRMVDDGVRKTRELVDLLKEHGYEILAYSDSLEEVSFVKRS